MSTLYIITNTVGNNVFSILPGALNGPGGSVVDSDLRLYGQGSTIYGEGTNENLYRITESFACPEKAGSPGIPQDETDLGTGNGINNPLTGQPWYNTSTNKLLVFDETAAGFINPSAPSSGAMPGAPILGDLWYDTTDVDPFEHQLKVYTGSVFLSTSDRYVVLDGTREMSGDLTITNASPRTNLKSDTDGVGYLLFQDSAGTNRASVAGNTATGGLVLENRDIAGVVVGTLTLGTDGNVTTSASTPSASNDLTQKNYVDNNFVADAGGTMSGKLTNNNEIEVNGILDINGTSNFLGDMTLASGSDITLTTGGRVVLPGMVLNEGDGNVATGADIHINATGLIAADSSMRINIDGDNVSSGNFIVAKGATTSAATNLFTIENNGRIISNLANYETLVTTDDSIPNKKYVDDEIAGATGALGTVPEVFTSLTASAKLGDIAIVSSKIYINLAAGNNFKQVWPAIYT